MRLVDSNLIGPYFLPEIWNCEIYENFLCENLMELLLANRINMIFQCDGYPIHYFSWVKNFLG